MMTNGAGANGRKSPDGDEECRGDSRLRSRSLEFRSRPVKEFTSALAKKGLRNRSPFRHAIGRNQNDTETLPEHALPSLLHTL